MKKSSGKTVLAAGTEKTLRERAEEKLREQADKTKGSSETLSNEAARQLLHELHVHQIELEIQNEELRRNQEELIAARERYFDLYDMAPAGYCSISEKGIILEANLEASKQLGVTRNDLVNQSFSRFVMKEDQDMYYLHRQKLFERRERQECELRMVRRDGTQFWVFMETVLSRDNDDLPVCRVVLNDITMRKRREEERELTGQLILLISASGDFRQLMAELTAELQKWSGCEAVGIRLKNGEDYPYYETRGFPPEFVKTENQLCTYGPDGTIERDNAGNPVLECMCGNILSGRFNPAKPFFTRHGSFWTNNTSALLAGTTEADRQARTRNRCNGEGYESVALIPLREGEQTFGLLQFNDHLPNRFSLEQIEHLERMADNLAIALARREAEEALCESEKRFQQLFDHMAEGVAVYEEVDDGEDFIIVDMNSTGQILSKVSLEEIAGRRITEVFPDVEQMGLLDVFRRVWHSGEPEYLPIKEYVDDRIDHWVENYVYKLPSGLIVAIYSDTTEKQRANEEKSKLEGQLQQAQKMESVGRLAGGVAHDFNNMLGVILGHTEMILNQMDPSQPFYDGLREIQKAAERSANLTRQLLAFARKQTVTPRILDLNVTIESMLKMIKRLIGEHIELTWQPGEKLWPVKIDPTQIDQILVNLCVNAGAAISGVGEIRIETRTITIDKADCNEQTGLIAEEYVQLIVIDDGIGMSTEVMSNLFEPFFTTKEMGKGTGLGLATVYGIVKQNDGYIRVDSEPGVGTTFKIYLPRCADEEIKQQKKESREIELHGQETILLVEDEPSILKLATMLLERQGYSVLTASTPGEAISLAQEHKGEIQLLMIDVVMPEMNGHELADKLLRQYPRLKCLYMSGYTQNVIEHDGVLDKNVQFIQKPFSSKELAGKVREALDM